MLSWNWKTDLPEVWVSVCGFHFGNWMHFDIYHIYHALYRYIYITLHMDVRADFTVVIGYILEMHMDDGQHVDRKEGCRDQDH